MGEPASGDLTVSVQRAAEMLDQGVQLIDVRTAHEYEAGHVAGARPVELPQLSAEAETIDRDRPIVFQCRSGNRSGMAADAFRQAGYEAYNMDGGLEAWVDAGLPLEPEDGEVASSPGAS